ncbi:hypothetical protein PR048_018390 [Dryococelus australis]|uniref:Uncharacterized protein n=1 Tax=Dryococelus australis TaxID=614101 RepID=A0ABQ9HCC4_9NEOP|nr:hypothetical protein PR048_018390 [Dryococelus australis]
MFRETNHIVRKETLTLPLTGKNFEVKWLLLTKRYDKKRVIMTLHLNSLLDVPTVPVENNSALHSFLSTINEPVS